jgi:hypothetical protein
MAGRPMSYLLDDILDKLSSPIGYVHEYASFQLAMLMEKNSRPSDEEGFYESVLPPELLAIELSEREQEEILTEIAKKTYPADVTTSFLWAVGKSSPRAGLPVLLRFLSEHSDLVDDANASYQAVIALENCLDHDKDESAPLAEDRSETSVVFGFLQKGSSSSDERLAEHSSRLLKRLRLKKPR